MRIATGMALLLLLTAAGCGGDDDGIGNPLAPSGIAPTDTASGQWDASPAAAGQPGDLTGLVDGMRAAKVDKRTIDFSGVSWSWNTKRTHLEPSSLPDARVQTGSNVWRRDDGTGLIRILSDADLAGMSFSTAGGSWPLSMRRAGLYVSGITGAEVDQISSGGGGRGPRTNHPALQCNPSNTNPTNATRLGAIDPVAGTVSFLIQVTCNRVAEATETATIVAAGPADHFYSGTSGTTEVAWVNKNGRATVAGGSNAPTPPLYNLSVNFDVERNDTGSLRTGRLVWVAAGQAVGERQVQQAAPRPECSLPTVGSFSARAVDPRHNRITWRLPSQSSSCPYTRLELDVVTPSRSSAVQISAGDPEDLATEYIHGAPPTCPEQGCGALTADEATVTYKIRTTNYENHNAGPWSREVTVNRSTAATPTAPLYLRARHQESGHVELIWDKPTIPEDEAGVTYSFQAEAGGGSWRSFTAFSMCDGCSAKERLISFADMPPVGRATDYRFRVRAIHNGRSGPWSDATNPARTWNAPGEVDIRLSTFSGDVGTAGKQYLVFGFSGADSHLRNNYDDGHGNGSPFARCEISVGNRSSYQLATSILGLDCLTYAAASSGTDQFAGLYLEWSQTYSSTGLPVNQPIWIRFSLRRGTVYGPTQEVDIMRNGSDQIVSRNADPPRGTGNTDPCADGSCNQPPDPPWSEATYGDGYLTMRWTTTQNTGYFPGTNSADLPATIRRMEMKYEACPHRWDVPRSRFVRIGGAVGASDTNCRTGTGTGTSTGTMTFRGSFGTIDGHQVDMWDAKMNARAVNSLGRPSPWAGWTGGHVTQD